MPRPVRRGYGGVVDEGNDILVGILDAYVSRECETRGTRVSDHPEADNTRVPGKFLLAP